MDELSIERDGVQLAGQAAGDGPAVILLHGLTATRRYVVMGSTALERSAHRVISYDARGHGQSSPAPSPDLYGYDELGRDLIAVLDATGVQRAVLAGASMGAHTLLWLALKHPDRIAGLVVITPAYGAGEIDDPDRLERWDALSDGLRNGGIDGFIRAYGEPQVREQWRETVIKVIRQRLSQHQDLNAVADALRAVPRSRPFDALSELEQISAPTTVVASGDDADPGHPQAVGEAYAERIPGAELVTDSPGSSPVAWQGSQLSRVIAAVVARSQG